MRIHLGCGDKYWPGFVNVDFTSGDIHSDIRKIPFEDNSADEIHLIHVFEHLDRMDAENALREWQRVLKPGGKLVMEFPCLDKVAKYVMAGSKDLSKTLFALYGDVRLKRPEMLHRWCWSETEILKVLGSCGFVDSHTCEPFFHMPDRDIRVIAYRAP